MKHVTVIAPMGATIQGRLQLSEEQARTRAHALKVLDAKRGIYETTAPVQFKRGESFGFEGEIAKALAPALRVSAERTPERGAGSAAKAASLV